MMLYLYHTKELIMEQVLFRMEKSEKRKLKIRYINLGFSSLQDYLINLIKLDQEKGLLKPNS